MTRLPILRPCRSILTGVPSLLLLILVAVLPLGRQAAAQDPVWIELPNAATPDVAYSISETDAGLILQLRIPPWWDQSVSARRTVTGVWWDGQEHRLSQIAQPIDGDPAIARFELPKPPAGVTPRFAFQVSWWDHRGQFLQQQSYRSLKPVAPHGGLYHAPEALAPFDLDQYRADVLERELQIRVPISQPMDGKLTVVIETPDGRRVRNLVAGRPADAGEQTVVWDGLDDDGQLVPPGDYRWRAAHHPGITPAYQFTWANGGEQMFGGFGSNHSRFEAVATNGELVFYGAPMTEGGHALIAIDPADGKLQQGYRQIHGTGIQTVAIAADATHFYSAHDGRSWLQKVDRSKPDWTVQAGITLARYEIATGAIVAYPHGQHQFATLENYESGPGAADERFRSGQSLTGMVLLGDRLYVGSRQADAILIVNPRNAEVEGRIAVPNPGAIATTPAGKLLVQSGDKLLLIDPANGGAQSTLATPAGLQPRGLTVAADGRIYVSDQATETIRILAADGAETGSLGVPGGTYAGPFVAERLVNPRGLTVFGDRLWVAEDRRHPKRLTAWDLATGTVTLTKYGNPPYGGAGGGFNRDNSSQWIGLRAGWQVNMTTGEARCVSVLQRQQGHLGGAINFAQHYKLFEQDGRTFVLGMAKAQILSELLPDGSLKDLAVIGKVGGFRYACGWNPPAEWVKAADARWEGLDHGDRGILRGVAMMWVDRSGDGEMQAEEIEFSDESVVDNFGLSYWGNDQYDLTWRFPVRLKEGGMHLATFAPDGWYAGGAPRYPALAEVMAQAVPIELDSKHFESTVDRFGNLYINGEPYMTAHAPDGRLLWRYPNNWVGVHGSHKAPLPEIGVMQGNLFFLGTAPIDATTDALMLVGNHGRCFVLTSDGLYLDEMFSDVRVSRRVDEWMVGGEAFGGVFGADEQGRHWLQVGGDGYRVYRVNGLDQLSRSQGSLAVSAEQLAAAERQQARQSAPPVAMRPSSGSPVKWDRDGKFPVQVDATVNGGDLTLRYTVADDSPWVNNGTDIATLFKSGDAVDFHFATDPQARPGRRDAAIGDKRLLIAPMGDENVAVLYDFHLPEPAADPVILTSPWRSVSIDRVRQLESATIDLRRENKRYTLTVTVPLADLGLPAPPPTELAGDLGVIYGDADGTINVMRSYWANPSTALVNDVPGEAMLSPNAWGTLRLVADPDSTWSLVDAGAIGNSGSLEEPAGYGDGRAFGLGAPVDRHGRIWDRTGTGLLQAFRVDGAVEGRYPLPAANPRDRHAAIAVAGDHVVLLLDDRLYTLPIDAKSETAPTDTGISAQQLSLDSHDGTVAIARGARVHRFDPASGESHDIGPLTGDPTELRSLVMTPSGEIIQNYGQLDLNGVRPQRIGDYWYSQGWHSTVSRFTADRRADPGVVLGGNSGHYIGTVDEPAEIIYGRGMGRIDGSPIYTISGEEGVLHLLRWSDTEKAFSVVRRLGALPFAGGLAIDRDGHVFTNRGIWDATALPPTPQRDGGPVLGIGQAASLPGGGIVMAAYQYGSVDHSRLLYGDLHGRLTGRSDHVQRLDPIPTGAAVYRGPQGQLRLILLAADGRGQLLRVSGDGRPWDHLGTPHIQLASPVSAYTSLGLLDDDALLAAADGHVIVLSRTRLSEAERTDANPDGIVWTETARWNSWGDDPASRFGAQIYIHADAGRLWVSDTERHRVLCFDARDRRLIAQFGETDQFFSPVMLKSPTRIAATGDHAVVHDSGNHRLRRLRLTTKAD